MVPASLRLGEVELEDFLLAFEQLLDAAAGQRQQLVELFLAEGRAFSRGLHLDKLGVSLTTMSDDQASYVGLKSEGPFKPEHYRY
ncbi:MAG: adenosylhomocysteinase [Acidobacteria bacterium]|nr:adenosylhomocysteinase [Acidobacteriota bacterium]